MPDPYRKVKPGDTLEGFPSNLYNAVVDMANHFHLNGPWGQLTKTPPPSGPVERGVVVPIRNDSGEDVARYGILRVTGALFTPDDNEQHFLNRPCLKGDTPDDSDDQIFVIMQEPIDAATAEKKPIRMGMLLGVTPVLLDVQDEADRFAAPVDGDTETLQTGSSGAEIVWKESGTGICHGYVRMGGGGGGECRQNEVREIFIAGSPTGGTFTMTITINGTPDTVTINWDDTATEVETALEGHSEIGSGNVEVTGDGLPNASMVFELVGDLANTPIDIMTSSHDGLTGGTGMGLTITRVQRGQGA